MAELAVRRPLAEAHLRHELGLHPVRAFPRKPELVRNRRGVALGRPEFSYEHVEVLAFEAGTDLAAVLQRAVLVVGDEQGTEILPAPGGIGPADDHHLLIENAFELEPVA